MVLGNFILYLLKGEVSLLYYGYFVLYYTTSVECCMVRAESKHLLRVAGRS